MSIVAWLVIVAERALLRLLAVVILIFLMLRNAPIPCWRLSRR